VLLSEKISYIAPLYTDLVVLLCLSKNRLYLHTLPTKFFHDKKIATMMNRNMHSKS
jgi:hypothetical protein